ncbi:NAD+ synthase [Kaustia mangrovi]|uniref:Glutamine-dependent NAD(+) synthetase n=1 Tax=Kaustia mangrovi TaxID=2593653 RepID=A0A7S8C7U8_9HYPH|nr:NAD+ synthase [Kaustia mangrovi]QPC44826.1 NAD+ synthase [Kaustia mangrovi]
MTDRLDIALAQLNPTVGAIDANLAKAREARARAAEMGADLVLFTELFMTGYPPEDLVLKSAFQRSAREAVEALAADTADGGPGVIMGTPWVENGEVYNAIALLDGGRVETVRYKYDLPNYGVFDEKRVFAAGPAPGPVNFRGVRIGVPICEDVWTDEVCECLEETAAEFFLVPNGSPYEKDKTDVRLNLVVARVTETGLPMVYLNQVGGQDELVFDGSSFVLNADRSLALQMPAWEEQIVLTRWRRGEEGWLCEPGEKALIGNGMESVYRACVLGLRDYVNKNGFASVVLGLSGGIDSAICAALSVDALGADRVRCVMLPYKYTASSSLDDAEACAAALGVDYDVVPIAEAVEGFSAVMKSTFDDLPADITEENIQSRVRGTALMAISNKFGPMVVTTGNKSEVSVGYATLYGDMNGGFNPIKDLYKTQVYALARYRNQTRPSGCLGPEGRVIPENIITKAPSAELREDQTDQDSLPPYDILDDILECLVEHEMSVSDIVARGHDRDLVKKVERLLYIAEYKRRQAAPGVKITSRMFGRDRRYPITNHFRDRD